MNPCNAVNRARVAAAVGILVLAAGHAAAHETWLLPSTFSTEPGQEVRFDLTSGMRFPHAGNSIKAERLDRAGVTGAAGATSALPPAGSASALALSHRFTQPDTHTVWLGLKPKDIALSDAQVAAYLDEINAGPALRQQWAMQKKARVPWRETYTKHAKTIVQVGHGDEAADSPAVGMALELVPVGSPSQATQGQPFKVRLLFAGKPLASTPVGLMISGASRPQFQSTDAQGTASFPLSRPGNALLYAVHLRPKTTDAGQPPHWVSDFSTLTLRIKPR